MSFADRREPFQTAQHWLRSRARRYEFAVVAVALATVARYGLGVAVGFLPPFVLFFFAIILVALLAGFGPAVLATLLSATSVAFFFWQSLRVFGGGRVRDIVGLAVFTAIGGGISGLADLYRRHEARLHEFERVVETSEDMMVVVDREYRYVLANQSFLKYRGMQREQVIGRPVSEVLNP